MVATAFLGATTRITVRLPDASEVKSDVPTRRAGEFPVGTAVAVGLPDMPVLVVDRAVR